APLRRRGARRRKDHADRERHPAWLGGPKRVAARYWHAGRPGRQRQQSALRAGASSALEAPAFPGPLTRHMSKDINKVVLSYSGGLDTSIILKWLQETYRCEVVTFTADLGQGEELEPARRKAEMLGIRDIRIEDLREEFVRDFVF